MLKRKTYENNSLRSFFVASNGKLRTRTLVAFSFASDAVALFLLVSDGLAAFVENFNASSCPSRLNFLIVKEESNLHCFDTLHSFVLGLKFQESESHRLFLTRIFRVGLFRYTSGSKST